MTDSEYSAAHNDSDEDIYKDFSDFNFGDELAKVEACKEQYKEEVNNLTEKIKTLSEENDKFKKLNTVLEKNLSTLLKTAQAEIKRKDAMIDELRTQIDSFAFRRKQNKTSKDQSTNTDEWESVINYFIGTRGCACGQESAEQHSLKTRDKEHKSLRSDIKKSKQESSDCDNDILNYSLRDLGRNSGRHFKNNSNTVIEKYKECSYSLRDRNDSSHYKRNQRDHSGKHSEERSRHSRRSNEHNYSPHRDRGSRKINSRDKTPERRGKRHSERYRSRSLIREHSRHSRDRSIEELKTSSRLEKNSRSKSRNDGCIGRERNTTDGYKGEVEKKCDYSSLEKGKDRRKGDKKEEKPTKEGNSGENRSLDKSIERKSLLDGLYTEMVKEQNSLHTSKPESSTTAEPYELEEGECDESETSMAPENHVAEDWKLSFKNERPKDSRPMTLYSKRMMNKLSCKPSSKDTKWVKKSEVNEKSVLSEREPGEFTDDESLIEKSEEFREVAKAAVLESKVNVKPLIITSEDSSKDKNFSSLIKPSNANNNLIKQPTNSKTDGKNKNKEILETENKMFNEFQVPFPVEPVLDKKEDGPKDFREVIEFSPFKNNYKLIEISPAKVSNKGPRLCELNQKSNVICSPQKGVEKSIFNLLSRLSGVPTCTDKSKPTENIENKNLTLKRIETVSKSTDVHSECIGDKTTGKNIESDVKKKSFEVASEKSSQKKTITVESYLNKKQGKKEKEKEVLPMKNNVIEKEEKTNNEVPAEEVSPGETTQFLNFFLLTTSPSKPILPAEEEKLLENTKCKENMSSPKERTESDDSPNTSDTSDVKGSATDKVPKNSTLNLRSLRSKNSISNEKHSAKTTKGNPEPKTKDGKKEKVSKTEAETEKAKETENDKSSATTDFQVKEKKEKVEKNRRKRKLSEKDTCDSSGGCKKSKIKKIESVKKEQAKSENNSKSEENSEEESKVKEDISFFEFFKPIVKREDKSDGATGKGEPSAAGDFKMTTKMSVTGVVRLETPNKCVEKLQNLMINESTVYQVVDTRINSPFSPMIGTKMMEMTPRRMLKNDLMLTDSEDDSGIKNSSGPVNGNVEREEMEVDEDNDEEVSLSESSDCDSDSGASDFVDQL